MRLGIAAVLFAGVVHLDTAVNVREGESHMSSVEGLRWRFEFVASRTSHNRCAAEHRWKRDPFKNNAAILVSGFAPPDVLYNVMVAQPQPRDICLCFAS